MKILLTGGTGQVGYQLQRSLQTLGEVVAPNREQMDLSDPAKVREVVREVKPDLIVNPGAYTAVDMAETERELAMRVNAEAPAVLAEEAKKLGAKLVHYSTDYVFDGSKGTPYTENDATCPLNVYGHSKVVGEQAIQGAGIDYLIFRTSWVYSQQGKNFLLTILRLAQANKELRIVGDQLGAPTWSRTIADTTSHVLAQAYGSMSSTDWWQANSGIYHLTSQGQTTWAKFAEAIIRNAGLDATVVPITTEEYPLPAARPRYSVLSGEKIQARLASLPDWEKALRLSVG